MRVKSRLYSKHFWLLHSALFFSAELLCDFENENQCNFEVSTDDMASQYLWKRYNSKELEENGIPGPSSDYANEIDRYYMIASDTLAGNEGLQGAVSQLKSPLFNAGEHPLECFQFWFFFGNEVKGDELAIAMTNKDEEDAKIVWILSDSYEDKNKWVQGRVEIRPPDDPNLEYRVCAKVFYCFFSNATTEAKCNFPLFLFRLLLWLVEEIMSKVL